MLDGLRKAVLYARVSTQEQEREGFSIPAQIKLIHGYADLNGIGIAAEFIDVETARKTGRTQFGLMLDYLRKHLTVRGILVEKTDRLYRNLKDWVTMDDLGVEIHFVKEGVVLSGDSRSSEKFMHGIKVLMAKNYIDNLSEEARKGMKEKAEQGYWPTLAPLGYRNVRGPDGRKIIEIDPERGPVITRLFEWCATGRFTLRELADKAREAGLRNRTGGRPVRVSTLHRILRNRVYSGVYEWKGELCQGHHAPLVSAETWDNAQEVLDARSATNVRARPMEFPFTGLMTCGHCGCAMVGEIKKGRYIYYHCTGFRGKCGEPYVRQEVIEERFREVLGRLHFDDEIFALIQQAIREGHADERREHDERIERLRAEADRLLQRIDTLYMDRIEGRITAELHDRLAPVWREERARCLRDMEALFGAEDAMIDDGLALLDFARNAASGFEKWPLADKRSG
ncbi:recombinase family protein [Sphingomonas sp. XMGL2]|uniref:Recombinase family protein n=2 Tax=Sphingomonas quercus TaxID=2842451 RepID=A0ABS6BHQ2_9SPHN|nr:recombinase family protein [Sphingomonas quercus]